MAKGYVTDRPMARNKYDVPKIPASLEEFEAEAKVRHAQLLVKHGRYEEALPLLRHAQQLKPRDNLQDYLEQVERAAKSR
jgi:hypothetical protein